MTPVSQQKNHILPDLLAPGLNVVFVGTAAGIRSAQQKAYYASSGNRFWRTLFDVGITPRLFRPEEYRELLSLGIGATDLCKTQAGADHAIDDFDVSGFERKIWNYRPRAIAFTSKKGGSIWLNCSTGAIRCGLQSSARESGMAVFVLPSPSGRATSHWDITPWQQLACWLRESAPV